MGRSLPCRCGCQAAETHVLRHRAGGGTATSAVTTPRRAGCTTAGSVGTSTSARSACGTGNYSLAAPSLISAENLNLEIYLGWGITSH